MIRTREQIVDIIARTLGISPDVVTDELSIGDIPEWDSVGNLALTAAIEQELGVEIPLDDLFEMTSVSSIIAEIAKLKNG